MFHIEVFNALQTTFGPSKYTTLKQSLKSQPRIEYEDVTWNLEYNMFVKHASYKKLLVNFHSSLESGDSIIKSLPFCFLTTIFVLELVIS